jgi:hypothetical protein
MERTHDAISWVARWVGFRRVSRPRNQTCEITTGWGDRQASPELTAARHNTDRGNQRVSPRIP